MSSVRVASATRFATSTPRSRPLTIVGSRPAPSEAADVARRLERAARDGAEATARDLNERIERGELVLMSRDKFKAAVVQATEGAWRDSWRKAVGRCHQVERDGFNVAESVSPEANLNMTYTREPLHGRSPPRPRTGCRSCDAIFTPRHESGLCGACRTGRARARMSARSRTGPPAQAGRVVIAGWRI